MFKILVVKLRLISSQTRGRFTQIRSSMSVRTTDPRRVYLWDNLQLTLFLMKTSLRATSLHPLILLDRGRWNESACNSESSISTCEAAISTPEISTRAALGSANWASSSPPAALLMSNRIKGLLNVGLITEWVGNSRALAPRRCGSSSRSQRSAMGSFVIPFSRSRKTPH